MSLFDGEPIDIAGKVKSKVVLSASRMTDMPKYYPIHIIEEVEKRISKGIDIHTLVLWTKHAKSLLANPLSKFLADVKSRHGIQLYLQLTITGLGGIRIGTKANGNPLILEPKAPSYRDSIDVLPEIIALVGKPERVRLRIDPIVRVADSTGLIFSSLKMLPIIIQSASLHGIKHYSFSFLEKGAHRKVDCRFKEMGCTIIPPTAVEREQVKIWIKRIEQQYGVSISACCTPGFEETRCIHGNLLEKFHDDKEKTDLRQPRKRHLCGCTNSIDIGGWPPKKCFTGCDYCYANSNYID